MENEEEIKKVFDEIFKERRGSDTKYLSPPTGILRVDSRGGRRSEKTGDVQKTLVSPQPSVDRVSVTFAEDSIKSEASTKYNSHPKQQHWKMDKKQGTNTTDEDETEDEDYSASVNAIMQRRASIRKSRKRSTRRGSSPFNPDILPGAEGATRRRSSGYTSSSGETAITIEDSVGQEMTQDQIFENIKLHKEVLSNVKMQPWNMRRKLKLVVQAKNYVKRHEGALQERFTQSRSIKDMMARWNIYLAKKLQHFKREIANLSNVLTPWELRIKEIESHFGSVVASYFIFLRWLFWVNLVTAAVLLAFVAIPELLTADPDTTRKNVLPEEKYNSTNFLTLWDFEGVLKYTPLFYGWYTNHESPKTGYKLPLAYFMTQLVLYVYSFVAILSKMAENSRMSKLSEKDDECVFTWKLFTGWDYMIGNAETAHNRVMSIVMGFKEALLEEAEKKRDSRNWKVIVTRVFVNTMVISLFVLSAVAVVVVVKRSTNSESKSSIWRRNETTMVLTLITMVFPMAFEALGLVEKYHPRKTLRVQLGRIMVLNLLNLYSLIFATFDEVTEKIGRLNEILLSLNRTTSTDSKRLETVAPFLPFSNCVCQGSYNGGYISSDNLVSTIVTNLTATILPKFLNTLNNSEELFTSTAGNVTETYDFSNTSLGYNNEIHDFMSYNEGFDNFSNFIGNSINNLTDDMSNFSLYYNSTITYYNKDIMVDLGKLYEYFKNFWEDYLYSVISSFNQDSLFVINQTAPSLPSSTEISIQSTSVESAKQAGDFESFKSTLSPSFSVSTEYWDERFETELATLHSEVQSTIGTIQENITDIIRVCEVICQNNSNVSIGSTPTTTSLEEKANKADSKYRSELRNLCWETIFGQEIVKLTVMDLIMTSLGILGIDFFRGLFVRIMNRCWCWDLEKKFPEYGEFKVAENILHLVNNQGMVWMGMFFSPGIVWINVIKLYILMYLRSWAVLTCNVPHAVIFRASRSNNFYFTLLLLMLFLCTLPVGYAVVWVKPSWHCGPFSNYKRIFYIFTETIKTIVPSYLHKVLDYIASPGIVIPLLVLLVLIIYYLVSLTSSLREANNDLKVQLRQERTEERRKMFQLADRRRRIGSTGSGELENTPYAKWKKLLNHLPSQKSLEETVKETDITPEEEKKDSNETREVLSKFIRRALRMSTSEEETPQVFDDATDAEQHESLPDDVNTPKQDLKLQSPKPSHHDKGSSVISSFQNTVHLALTRKRSSPDSSEPLTSDSKHQKTKISSPIHKQAVSVLASPNLDEIRISSADDKSKERLEVQPKWSEKIPVITISKTESDESILQSSASKGSLISVKEKGPKKQQEASESKPTKASSSDEKTSRFESDSKSKAKRKLLRKQSTVEMNRDGAEKEAKNKHGDSLSI